MKRVDLVFLGGAPISAPPFGHASRAAGLAVLLLVAVLAAMAIIAWKTLEMRQQAEAAHSTAIVLRARLEPARPPSAGDKQILSAQQSRAWNLIARQLNIRWPSVLDALENSTPETVALVAIEPDPSNGSVRLLVEAKTLDTLLGYAEKLQTSGPFEEVVLLKHETNDQDPTQPFRLSLDARLKPIRPASVDPRSAR